MYGEHDPRAARQGRPVLAAFLTSILTTTAAFAALTVADRRGLLDFLHADRSVAEVPSITGASVDQARDLLRARGLLLTLQAERPDSATPAGKIAGQVPLAGSRATQGTAIQAFVSSGPDAITVPTLTGIRPDDAAEQLRGRHLALGPRREEASASIAAGLVIGTEPVAGKAASPDTSVALIVSNGPPAQPVPKVVGFRLSKAKKTIEASGFKVGSTTYGSSDNEDEGVVLKQEPSQNTPATPGSAVNLVVNE